MVQTYLAEPWFQVDDPIAHWTAELRAGRRVGLALMALDYLSIPCEYFLPTAIQFHAHPNWF